MIRASAYPIALIDCNNFYVSCERVFDMSLRGIPVIVLSNNDGCAVARSDEVGALEPDMQRQLSGFIGLSSMPVSDLIAEDQSLAAVPARATAAEVRAAARQSRHMRILMDAESGRPLSFIHVRDMLLMADEAQAATVARPALSLDAQMPVYEALARLRGAGVQIAIVKRGTELCGIITLADILKLVLPAGTVVTKEMSPGEA